MTGRVEHFCLLLAQRSSGFMPRLLVKAKKCAGSFDVSEFINNKVSHKNKSILEKISFHLKARQTCVNSSELYV